MNFELGECNIHWAELKILERTKRRKEKCILIEKLTSFLWRISYLFSLLSFIVSFVLSLSSIFAKMIVNRSDKESDGIEKDMALVACRWKSQLVSSTLGVGYVESFGCFVECKSIGNWITLQRTIRDRDLCGTLLYRIFKCSRGIAFLFAKLLRKIESRRFVDCNVGLAITFIYQSKYFTNNNESNVFNRFANIIYIMIKKVLRDWMTVWVF